MKGRNEQTRTRIAESRNADVKYVHEEGKLSIERGKWKARRKKQNQRTRGLEESIIVKLEQTLKECEEIEKEQRKR